MDIAQFGRDPLGLHYGGAPLGQHGFFASSGGKPGQLGEGVAQVIGLRSRLFDPRPLARVLGRETPHPCIGGAHFGGRKVQAAKGIDQLAMRAWIDERAVVVLAMNFDQFAGDRPQPLRGQPLIVDESAAAAIRQLQAPQNKSAGSFYVLCLRRDHRLVVLRKFESRADLTLRRAVADQAAVAPGAKRQRKRVEKNRFAGAGLAGQNGKATVEFEIKLVDQNDVADGQLNEHGVEGLPDAPPYGAALPCFMETGKSFNSSL